MSKLLLEANLMRIDDFVECDINSVSVVSVSNGSKKVLFRILDHDKKTWELCADDVTYFLVNGMCLQNLIESIKLYETYNINENLKEARWKIFYLLQGRYPGAQGECPVRTGKHPVQDLHH